MKISIPKQEYEVKPEDLSAVQEFLASIVPGFVKEFGGVLQDGVKGWRARNMINILVQTKELIEKSGLTSQELSGKFFVQALDKASIEDDESLQNKWATLLANASTGKVANDVKYISILSELNSDEVRLLEAISTEVMKGGLATIEGADGKHYRELVFSTYQASKFLNIQLLQAQIMVDDFYRLNICQPPAITEISTGGGHAALRTNASFTLTDLGWAFLDAVKS